MKKEEINIEKEYVLIAGVELPNDDRFEYSMNELSRLCEACGLEVAGSVTQSLDCKNNAYYLGPGKVIEIRDLAHNLEVGLIVFNDTLTPSQLRNLQDETDTPVMDRTMLILEIFRKRARSREARLQVELASLEYLKPRLTGMYDALTRQGGTSGSMSNRGAGETKLELDRRRMDKRLVELRRELKEVASERVVQRKQRKRSGMKLAALVGYTNARKSTLMNAIVDRYVRDEERKVFEADMLFATLDTTVRRVDISKNKSFLLSDTVGFVNKLPTGLVEAFKSTLEEIKEADLILHVVDRSDPMYAEQMETTERTLRELGAGHIPEIIVYNKMDALEELEVYRDENVIDLGAAKLCMTNKDGISDTEVISDTADIDTDSLAAETSDKPESDSLEAAASETAIDARKKAVRYPRKAGSIQSSEGHSKDVVYISAKDRNSVGLLTELIAEHFGRGLIEAEFMIPYEHGNAAAYLQNNAEVIESDYRENGTYLKLRCRKEDHQRYREFLIPSLSR